MAISKVVFGRLSEHSIGLIKLINKLMRVKFKITEIEKDDYDEEINEDEEDINDENIMDLDGENLEYEDNVKEEKQSLPR
jgi:hypothetical protein